MIHSQSTFVRLKLTLGLLSCLIGFITDSRAQERPNILIFFIDDLGWTDLGCFGSDLYETPNIDQLASEGIRFTDAYSACTVCSPSRAAIMTGKHPARLHLTDWIKGHPFPEAPLAPPDWTMYLRHDETTLAEYLGESGYATASIGKWHLGEDSIYWPQHQGFDLNVAGYSKGQPPSFFSPYVRNNWAPIPYLEEGPEGEYLTDRLADEAGEFIQENAESGKPFFLYFAHYAVHTPIQAPDSLTAYYQQKITPDTRHHNPTYAAMVHAVDQSVGQVRAELEALGEWDNTLVIFASDNGGLDRGDNRFVTDNDPLRAGKGTAYEGGVRTPLIIRFPGNEGAGQESPAPVITMDLFATALDAAGLDGAALARDGESLWGLRNGRNDLDDGRPLFWHYPHYHTQGATPYSAIRLGSYRLIWFYEDDHLELYDLVEDIGENHNLIGEEPRIARKLYRKLRRWKKTVGAQDPLVNPNIEH